MKKTFIQADELLKDSFELAWQVYESGYKPDYIVGVWRGGAPIGIAVQEFLDVLGIDSDHIAIRTSSYSGIAQREKTVQVHGLSYVIKKIESADSIILAGPNYSMNVNWLTKNLIDRFAYNLHRPMFFNKRFVLFITSGNYMGTKQALKALSVLPSGGKIIGELVFYTAPELSDKKRIKQKKNKI